MSDLEALTTRYAQAGQGRTSDALKARYYRLESDQLLLEAGGSLDPIAQPASPSAEAAPPSPPPSPSP